MLRKQTYQVQEKHKKKPRQNIRKKHTSRQGSTQELQLSPGQVARACNEGIATFSGLGSHSGFDVMDNLG
jgi:hypothetical protein